FQAAVIYGEHNLILIFGEQPFLSGWSGCLGNFQSSLTHDFAGKLVIAQTKKNWGAETVFISPGRKAHHADQLRLGPDGLANIFRNYAERRLCNHQRPEFLMDRL